VKERERERERERGKRERERVCSRVTTRKRESERDNCGFKKGQLLSTMTRIYILFRRPVMPCFYRKFIDKKNPASLYERRSGDFWILYDLKNR